MSYVLAHWTSRICRIQFTQNDSRDFINVTTDKSPDSTMYTFLTERQLERCEFWFGETSVCLFICSRGITSPLMRDQYTCTAFYVCQMPVDRHAFGKTVNDLNIITANIHRSTISLSKFANLNVIKQFIVHCIDFWHLYCFLNKSRRCIGNYVRFWTVIFKAFWKYTVFQKKNCTLFIFAITLLILGRFG